MTDPIQPLREQPHHDSEKLPPIVLKEVYDLRFNEADQATKDRIWAELGKYFQRYIVPGARVVDIACDIGYFIRHIHAGERWATDIRDVAGALPDDVRFVHASGLELAGRMPHDYFDLAFFSNYLEHLPSTEAVLEQLRVAHALLKPGGRILILQPNIPPIRGYYWGFTHPPTALTGQSPDRGRPTARVRAQH